MKKTSLILAISALLYGTSSTYATAAPMSFAEIQAIVDSTIIEPVADVAEDDDSLDTIQGTDPFTIPSYVSIDDSSPINRHGTCEQSFQVDGGEMAEFPVTVTFGNGDSQTVMWEINIKSPQEIDFPNETPYTGGVARGEGWFLIQTGDTWYLDNPWILYTEADVSITKIKLEPITPVRNGGLSYAFDIGGKDRYTTGAPEHTLGSSNGRVINLKKPPSPRVKFEATYSNPVYIAGHTPTTPHPHDLYGTLEIQFVDNNGNNIAIGGTTAIDVVDFAYMADTDCLPVVSSNAQSYQDGQLTFTLTMSKEGSGYIAERCGIDPTLVAGPFTVEDGEGTVEFSTDLILQPGCYYSVVNVANDGSMEAVPLEGVETNASNEYYHAQ